MKVVFHGGLFCVLPGSGTLRRVDVHMRLCHCVEVRGPQGRRLRDAEVLLASAARVDFLSPSPLRPERMPVRPVSDVVPIDYQGFRKTVSFTGGTVAGVGRSASRAQLARLLTARARGGEEEMLHEFEAVAGGTGHHTSDGPDETLRTLVASFFRDLTTEAVRRWLPGYRVEVRIPDRGARVVLNGRMAEPLAVPAGSSFEFLVDEKSVVPHFPASNPHFFERPPMS
jgi:hypothetical protein